METPVKYLAVLSFLSLIFLGSNCRKEAKIIEDNDKVNFFATPIQGLPPLAVVFNNESEVDAEKWVWNFGDGGTSTSKDPIYTYNTAGYYSVSLSAITSSDTITRIREDFIIVVHTGVPSAYFNINMSPEQATGRGLADETIYKFQDVSVGAITDWEWDFGDGAISTEKNPEHIYSDAGTYNVKLKVTGPSGSDEFTRSFSVDKIIDGYFSSLGPYWPSQIDGNCDFGSNGPKVNLDASVLIPYPWEVSEDIILRLSMHAEETVANESEAYGAWNIMLRDLPAGQKVISWEGDRHFEKTWNYTDNDEVYDYSENDDDNDDLCRFKIMGDTPGNDICGETYGDTHVILLDVYYKVRVGPN